jgi:hypothetical protein
MLVMKRERNSVLGPRTCTNCAKGMGYILIMGYGGDAFDLWLCGKCGLQLKSLLIEDLLELSTGYRNGQLVAGPTPLRDTPVAKIEPLKRKARG